MAAREEAGQPSPPGEVLEQPVGAAPRGPSPPDQTAPPFEEGWEEVGQEVCSRSTSLPASPGRGMASVGLPGGSPQSPSRASSAASGGGESSGRASLAGDRPEVSDPSGCGAMHAPHGGSLTASLLALVAEDGLGSTNEGADGVAEAASLDVGFAADPGLGPSASSLSCLRT